MSQIPYFVQFAHPDYKRPYIETQFGSGTSRDEIITRVEKHICHYLLEHLCYESIISGKYKGYSDINDAIYCEYYMDNSVINPMMFVDGKWTDVAIDYEKILKKVQEDASSKSTLLHNSIY